MFSSVLCQCVGFYVSVYVFMSVCVCVGVCVLVYVKIVNTNTQFWLNNRLVAHITNTCLRLFRIQLFFVCIINDQNVNSFFYYFINFLNIFLYLKMIIFYNEICQVDFMNNNSKVYENTKSNYIFN